MDLIHLDSGMLSQKFLVSFHFHSSIMAALANFGFFFLILVELLIGGGESASIDHLFHLVISKYKFAIRF